MRGLSACLLFMSGLLPVGAGAESPAPRDPKSPPRVQAYPTTPLAEFDEALTLAVEGQTIPLEIHRCDKKIDCPHTLESSRARFALSGPAQVQLRTKGPTIRHAALKTVGKDLPVSSSGQTLSFALPAPGHYYLQLEGDSGFFRTVYFWADDAAKPRVGPTDPGVMDVAKHGVASDAKADQTTAIQALLDRCAATTDGGTVYFPAGVYRCGSLMIGSNTTLYLDRGALLKAKDTPGEFAKRFLYVRGAHNARLAGPGTIDANSATLLAHRPSISLHNVDAEDCHDLVIEDLLFRDSSSWGVHLIRCDGVRIRNVKVFSNRDGFDPDSSRDVLIENVFVQSLDDTIAVKARYDRPCERIAIRNAIVSTVKSALKIGTETKAPIRGVTFENCEVFDTDRGIIVYARDGGDIECCVWRNIRMNLIDYPNEKDSGTAFLFDIKKRGGISHIKDCLVENVTTNFIYRSHFTGIAESPVSGVILRNITINAEPPKKDAPPFFECSHVADVRIEGLTINWQGNEKRWSGIVSGTGLTVAPPHP